MITAGAYAQSESTSRLGNQSQKASIIQKNENRTPPPDGFMLQNGNLVMHKDGKTTRVENDTTLSNGTVIMRDGHYMNKGESKAMFNRR